MIIDKPDPALDTLDTKSSLVKEKKVAFAPDVKPEAPVGSTSVSGDIQEKTVDGLIGQLEVHRSGLIKLRLSNGMLLDVSDFNIVFLPGSKYLGYGCDTTFILSACCTFRPRREETLRIGRGQQTVCSVP